jgi:5'-3' exonuclease
MEDVECWEDGYKESFNTSKFAVSTVDDNFRSKNACEYITELCWILQYYFQEI